ncbi:hypothetical protein ACF8FB_01285 [Pseudomonas sp. yb_2]|uniref:hypothetical protein n=1 Tax=Pseudomonas sp. yb_2 TaxID=3367218 RepID=UPI00370AFE32
MPSTKNIFEYDYFLKVAALGQFPILKITEGEYSQIASSRQTLSAALNMEESYDLAIGNFLDLEKELLLLTAEKVVDHRFDYQRAYELTSTLNRRTVNFILSGKNYTELIASKASKCLGSNQQIEETVKLLTNKEYEASLDYRLMEALRNHVSHSGVAIHKVTNPDRWILDDQKQAKNLVFNIGIYALKSRLAENSKFKKNVLDELPNDIDIKKAVRSYMGAISNIHEEVRKLTKPTIDQARATVELYLAKYAEQNDGKASVVGAYSSALHASGQKPIMLLLEWDDVRIELEKKNHSITNIGKRYVSSSLCAE